MHPQLYFGLVLKNKVAGTKLFVEGKGNIAVGWRPQGEESSLSFPDISRAQGFLEGIWQDCSMDQVLGIPQKKGSQGLGCSAFSAFKFTMVYLHLTRVDESWILPSDRMNALSWSRQQSMDRHRRNGDSPIFVFNLDFSLTL